jgi:hypothetical protein
MRIRAAAVVVPAVVRATATHDNTFPDAAVEAILLGIGGVLMGKVSEVAPLSQRKHKSLTSPVCLWVMSSATPVSPRLWRPMRLADLMVCALVVVDVPGRLLHLAWSR